MPTERPRPKVRSAPLPSDEDRIRTAIHQGVKRELEAVVDGLEVHADKLIKLYRDLSLDGESEAAAFRKVARDLRNRIHSLP